MNTKLYVQRRDKFISEFMNNIQREYRKSENLRDYTDRAIDLTVQLQVAPCNEANFEFVNDLLGLFAYAGINQKVARASVLTTVFHDLNEWEHNRNESWFCPRSSGYSKYLSGASNLAYPLAD